MLIANRTADVLSLVAPNGLGHFRRQVGILSRLLERIPDVRIHVLCADFQMALTRDWDLAVEFFADPRVERTGGILDPGIVWSTDASRYDDGSLLNWAERLRRVTALEQARLVVSDNLAGALAFRPDAVLVGSFLWGDVLARAHSESRPVRTFAAFESELLARHRPPMLCLKDMAMPAVVERTNAVPLGWMCEHGPMPQRHEPAVRRVGLLGGANGAADALLARAARELCSTSKYEVALPKSLSVERQGTVVFGHRQEDYAGLSAAICRPGLGTVTACIAEGVPMVTIHEGPSNPELSHVGERLASLGIAVDLGADPDERSVLAAVEKVLEPSTAARMRSQMLGLPRGGLERAADFLAARLQAAYSATSAA